MIHLLCNYVDIIIFICISAVKCVKNKITGFLNLYKHNVNRFYILSCIYCICIVCFEGCG